MWLDNIIIVFHTGGPGLIPNIVLIYILVLIRQSNIIHHINIIHILYIVHIWVKGNWDFRISNLVKSLMELMFNPCSEFR